MKEITVLLSASSSPSMPGLINCFRQNGERNIRIVGMDMSDDPSARFLVDQFYCVPAATADNYVDIVLDICRKEKIDIYFPNISAEVTAVTKRKEDFLRNGTIISASNQKAVEIGNNKLKLYEFLKDKNIDVPKYYGVHSLDEFEKGCKYMGYPQNAVCVKIVDGSGSRGVRIIDATRNRYQIFVHEKPNSFFVSYEDMISVLKEADDFHEMLLLEYLPGNEYTVDLLADHGEVRYMVGRENLVSLMSIAQESEVREDQNAYTISKEVVKALNLDGNIGIDFMRNADGKAVLTDLNPRITATVSVAAAAGVNLPYLRVKQLLGEPLPDVFVNYGVKLKRRYHELFCDKNGEKIDF